MRELARGNRKSLLGKSIEDVPAFRQHLARNGLRNLAEFEARNPGATQDECAELDLRYRYLKISTKGGARGQPRADV